MGVRSSRPCLLERRFKLQPQLPGQSMPTAVRYSATIADILSLVRPDRISPLRCAVRIVGDEEKAIVDALNALRQRCTYERGATAHDARPQGRILNKVSRGLASGNVIVMAQAKRAAEEMLERMRRAQSKSA